MAWEYCNGGIADDGRVGASGRGEAADEKSVRLGAGMGVRVSRGGGGGAGGWVEGMLHVNAMTDEQMEVLRKQISVYAAICEQLVEMHKAVTAQQGTIAGMRLGNLYCDPSMTPGGHKITARQRWTPTPLQLQILENIFDRGNMTPSKQKIKDIATELASHGQISESNVYNWFQNRRARSKRKQTGVVSNNMESEDETEVESPKEKKAKPDRVLSLENLSMGVDDISFQDQKIYSDVHSIRPVPTEVQGTLPSNESPNPCGNLGRMSFYNSVLANPSIDQLMGKTEVPRSYNPFQTGDDFDMVG